MSTVPSAPTLVPRAAGVRTTDDPVRIIGMHLRATMSVVELHGGRLLLFSPVEMTPERRKAVDRLGEVAHLYAPNTFHHLWMAPWTRAYPRAIVHAPSALRAKRPDLRIDREHDREPPPGDLAISLDEVHVNGFRLEESVLFHRASGTLLVADLVHNIGRPPELWTRIYAGCMGFYGRIAISRALSLTFRDRVAARASIDRIAELPFDRIVVGHGSVVEPGARAALLAAYTWLRPRRLLAQTIRPSET